MKRILVSILFITIINSAFAQLSKRMAQDTLIWKKDSALVKENFKAKSYGNNPAYSAIAIYIYQKEHAGNMMFHVDAIFLKSKSFMRDQSIYILKHEQMHFDICELYARKLRQRISEKDFKKVKDIHGVVQAMYTKTFEEFRKEEEKYDNDTQHGMNAAKQQVWNDNIAAQLTALDQFSNNAVDIVNK